MPVEFGYWALRGLGEPARLLLRHSGADWTDTAIPCDDEGKGVWFNQKKYNLGLDFPNLPYLIDGDVKASQTVAILRYLGRKFDMMPSDADSLRGDMLEQNMMDLRMGLARISYNPDFEKVKGDYIDKLEKRVGEIAKFIGEGPYAMGDKITYLDFLTFAFLDHVKVLSPAHFKEGPVAEYMTRFMNIPSMKKWFDSEGCTNKVYTVNAPFATWPGTPAKL